LSKFHVNSSDYSQCSLRPEVLEKEVGEDLWSSANNGFQNYHLLSADGLEVTGIDVDAALDAAYVANHANVTNDANLTKEDLRDYLRWSQQLTHADCYAEQASERRLAAVASCCREVLDANSLARAEAWRSLSMKEPFDRAIADRVYLMVHENSEKTSAKKTSATTTSATEETEESDIEDILLYLRFSNFLDSRDRYLGTNFGQGPAGELDSRNSTEAALNLPSSPKESPKHAINKAPSCFRDFVRKVSLDEPLEQTTTTATSTSASHGAAADNIINIQKEVTVRSAPSSYFSRLFLSVSSPLFAVG
jgi:hypothetical protein